MALLALFNINVEYDGNGKNVEFYLRNPFYGNGTHNFSLNDNVQPVKLFKF
jgi:hypothetical protein